MKLMDVTHPLHEGMIVYPGDPPFVFKQSLHQKESMLLSRLKMGLHTGTHVDAPRHYIPSGLSIPALPLTKYYGSCLVLDLSDTPFGGAIHTDQLDHKDIQPNDIVLFKTQNSLIPVDEIREDYVYLDPLAAQYLVKTRIKTVGIDYLSIDKMDSTESHMILLTAKIPIYEQLCLKDVNPGRYFFIGWPLPIVHAEGAPARVILIEPTNDQERQACELLFMD